MPETPNKQWTASVTFRTPYPLGQDTAMSFWGRGDRFHSQPGQRTYEWTARMLAPDLRTAVAYILDEIADVIADCEKFTEGPEFLSVDAGRFDDDAVDEAPAEQAPVAPPVERPDRAIGV